MGMCRFLALFGFAGPLEIYKIVFHHNNFMPNIIYLELKLCLTAKI